MIKTMKLKHLFFSSLLLSTAFVACTNEDILENPSVDAKDAIALGEGYAVNVSKGVDSRAAMSSNLTPKWEQEDKLGAAWFHRVTKVENGNVVTWDGVKKFGETGFYSNHPFKITKGVGTNNGTFEAPTNAFAGAYVLYYPYDPAFVMDNSYIDVKDIPAIQTMNCTAGHEYDAVNENMFVYGVNKLVPGGSQTQEIKLKQLPVLYQVKFKFARELRLTLTKPVTIAKVVLEAKDNDGNTVLTTDGTIKPDDANITSSNYNVPDEDANGNIIADHTLPAAIYEGSNLKTTDHISVNIQNSNKSAYQIAKLETLTEKPFIFSVLPFIKDAHEVVFKIVTTDGLVFKADYNAKDNAAIISAINGTDNAPGATDQGGQVFMNVELDVQETDDVVYTAEQFKEEWAYAMTVNRPYTIKIGEDIVLNEDLDYNQTYGHEVIVAAHCDDHSLTVNNLYATNGASVVFENPVIVKNEVITSASSELTTGDLTAKNITANGTAFLKVRKADLLKIVGSGDVTLSEVNKPNVVSRIEDITVESTKGQNGILRVSNYAIKNMANKGTVYVGEGVELINVVTNNSFVIVDDNAELTSYGVFNQYGDVDGKFINAAGAVMNIYRANDAQDFDVIVNEGKNPATGAAAAVVNINTNNVGSATPGQYVAFGEGSENKGIINIQKGMLGSESAQVKLQNVGEAVINVYKNATLYPYEENIKGGRVVMMDIASNVQSVMAAYVYFYATDKTAWTQVGSDKVKNYIVNGTLTVTDANEAMISSHNLHVENGILVLDNADNKFELNQYSQLFVDGNSTIRSSKIGVNGVTRNFILKSIGNEVKAGATLTLNCIKVMNETVGNVTGQLTCFGKIEAINSSYDVVYGGNI